MQRRHRLKKSAEFQRVRAQRRSWAHPLLVLYLAPNDLGVTRVGVSVSKRIGKAVVRNRTRRLIREAVRMLLPSLPQGHDLLFVARGPITEADYHQVSQTVEKLLARARLLPRGQVAATQAAQADGGIDTLTGKTDRLAAKTTGVANGPNEADRALSD